MKEKCLKDYPCLMFVVSGQAKQSVKPPQVSVREGFKKKKYKKVNRGPLHP